MIKKKMNDIEYESIRTEMIARITEINSQATAAWTTILAAWAILVTLIIIPYTSVITETNTKVMIDIVTSIFITLSICFLLPMAVKSGENLRQIVSISCYIRVFYEIPSLLDKSKEDKYTGIMLWETANNSISSVNTDKGKESQQSKQLFNQEYSVLSRATIILYIMSSTLAVWNYKDEISECKLCILLLAHVVVLIIQLYMSYTIRTAAGIKRNMNDYAPKCTQKYAEIAIHEGVYDKTMTVKKIMSLISNR